MPDDERGAALVEFTLIAPLLIALTFGMIQYSLLLFTWNNMMNTAREASREMAVGAMTGTAAKTFAQGMLVTWPRPWSVTTEDSVTDIPGATGVAHVRTTISVPSVSAGVVGLVPAPATLKVVVTMRKES